MTQLGRLPAFGIRAAAAAVSGIPGARRLAVLTYHRVPDVPDAMLPDEPDASVFDRQMAVLKRCFRVIPLVLAVEQLRRGALPARAVCVTFDDGYEDFAEHAWPVLKGYHYPATVFVVADRAGDENAWDRDSLGAAKKLMGWERIRELQRWVTFGSHSRTHPFLCRSTDRELASEVSGSKKIIEEKLQSPVDFFCYPYGDYDPRVKKAVMSAGYRGAVTTKRGLLHHGDDPYELRRTLIRYSTNPFLFFYKLSTGYEDRKSGRI